ncbi:MAG: hypothetical protein ACTSQJ_01255 [Promethearchaeota archaeon]
MDCIDTILEYFKDADVVNQFSKRIWVSKFILGLMKELHETKNYIKVQNCLILLLNLFFQIDVADHYHTKGKSTKNLSEKERSQLFELLRTEFNN